MPGSKKQTKKMSDEDHIKRVKKLADDLNQAADEAREDGLNVELYPNGEDADIAPSFMRLY